MWTVSYTHLDVYKRQVLYCWSELEDASFCVDVCGKKDLIVRIEGNSYKGNFSLRLLRSQEDREDTP